MDKEKIEVIDTKITDKWGVFWDEMETVRDFLQNFYDANPIENIKITEEGTTVKVFAPAIFDYQELIYLGSDKGTNPEAIGQYGEGWKASVLNAMRNFNCSVEIIVDNKHLEFFFEDKKIGLTVKRVVFCKVREIEPINGSSLIIKNCTKNILNEFKFGLKYFYSENNPLIGDELSSSWDRNIKFFKSRDEQGYVFYKRLLRSRIDAPIIIVCNKAYHHVEVKIKHDRDRKAFNDEVFASLLKYVCRHTRNKKSIVKYMEEYWVSGHKILSIMAHTVRWNDTIKVNFPEKYYAKDSNEKRQNKNDDFDFLIARDKVIEKYEKQGFIACPNYMSYFGMKTPTKVAKAEIEEKIKNRLQNFSREITYLEKNAISVLLDFVKKYSKNLYSKCQDFKFIIGDTQDTIKDLKKNESYDSKKIFLNRIFFTYGFSDALVFLITEFDKHSRSRFGEDFSAFYISLISSFLKEEGALNILKQYKLQWDKLIGMIVEEDDLIYDDSGSEEERNNLIKELRELFISGKLKEVIKKMSEMTLKEDIQNSFILLSEQYNTWHNEYIQGLDDSNSNKIKKIKRGFLELINQLAEQ